MKYTLIIKAFGPETRNVTKGKENVTFSMQIEDEELPRIGEFFNLDERDVPRLVVVEVERGIMTSQESRVDYRAVIAEVHWPSLNGKLDPAKMYDSFAQNRRWEKDT